MNHSQTNKSSKQTNKKKKKKKNNFKIVIDLHKYFRGQTHLTFDMKLTLRHNKVIHALAVAVSIQSMFFNMMDGWMFELFLDAQPYKGI